MRTSSLACLLLISSATAFSQVDTTRKEFFPLHIGDLWQYRTEDNFLLTRTLIGDTALDGYSYSVFSGGALRSSSSIMRIDSLLRVQIRRWLPLGGDSCGGNTPYEQSIYHLNEPDSAFWNVCENISGMLTRHPLVRFDGISLINVFGQPREVMRFDFGGPAPDIPGDTTWAFGALLARGIGVLHEQYYDGAYTILQGCIIDSVLYGTVVGIPEIPETQAGDFSLAQNFPNPFNPSTTIQYDLPEQSHVRLTVYDVLGREVVTLVDQVQNAGRHEVGFRGNGLASGVYIARFVVVNGAGGQVYAKTMKLMLMK